MMAKYILMGYDFNPYTGESEHYHLLDLEEYDGSVSWDYILDQEQEMKNDLEAYYRAVGLYGQADRLIDPYWETEPEPTDTEACMIVGEVNNSVYGDFLVEDHDTITEKYFYIIKKEE